MTHRIRLNLSFSSYCDTILKIPVSIPIVDPLKAKFTYQITEENPGGRRTGGCALGFLVSIHPGFSGYVLNRPASFPSKDWQHIEMDDIFEHCQKVAVPIIAHKYYNDLTPENMTPSISCIALFIRGAQKD